MSSRKGIILAGGHGTRLYPATNVICKQLLPIYDKPMIYYPLATLMLAGIQDIALISTPQDIPRFAQLLGTGADWGISLSYITQAEPAGIAQAFPLAATFIGQDNCVLILGDNLFYSSDLSQLLQTANARCHGASIFAYPVKDPRSYGVVSFDASGQALSIEEKPEQPRSRYAVTGLYFYDNQVLDIANHIIPSARGELEISDINQIYLQQQQLHVEVMARGMAWLDTGTHQSLIDAGQFISTIEKRQGLKVMCPEEIAYRQGFISAEQLERLAAPLSKSGYGQYLMSLLTEKLF